MALNEAEEEVKIDKDSGVEVDLILLARSHVSTKPV